MPRFEQYVVVGNVCKEPKVFQTKSGKNGATFTLAIDKGPKDETKTIFRPVKAWGYAAETVERLVHKGDLVLVQGELNEEEWTDKETDAKKTVTVVNAYKVECLNSSRLRGGRDDGDGGEQRRPSREPGDDVPF